MLVLPIVLGVHGVRWSAYWEQTGVHQVQNEQERHYLVKQIIQAARHRGFGTESELALDLMRCLMEILQGGDGSASGEVEEYVAVQLDEMESYEGWEGGQYS